MPTAATEGQPSQQVGPRAGLSSRSLPALRAEDGHQLLMLLPGDDRRPVGPDQLAVSTPQASDPRRDQDLPGLDRDDDLAGGGRDAVLGPLLGDAGSAATFKGSLSTLLDGLGFSLVDDQAVSDSAAGNVRVGLQVIAERSWWRPRSGVNDSGRWFPGEVTLRR
jgi:hypothetical protein